MTKPIQPTSPQRHSTMKSRSSHIKSAHTRLTGESGFSKADAGHQFNRGSPQINKYESNHGPDPRKNEASSVYSNAGRHDQKIRTVYDIVTKGPAANSVREQAYRVDRDCRKEVVEKERRRSLSQPKAPRREKPVLSGPTLSPPTDKNRRQIARSQTGLTDSYSTYGHCSSNADNPRRRDLRDSYDRKKSMDEPRFSQKKTPYTSGSSLRDSRATSCRKPPSNFPKEWLSTPDETGKYSYDSSSQYGYYQDSIDVPLSPAPELPFVKRGAGGDLECRRRAERKAPKQVRKPERTIKLLEHIVRHI